MLYMKRLFFWAEMVMRTAEMDEKSTAVKMAQVPRHKKVDHVFTIVGTSYPPYF